MGPTGLPRSRAWLRCDQSCTALGLCLCRAVPCSVRSYLALSCPVWSPLPPGGNQRAYAAGDRAVLVFCLSLPPEGPDGRKRVYAPRNRAALCPPVCLSLFVSPR